MHASPIIEKLAKLPRGQRFLVYLVVWLLSGAMFFFALYMPAQSEVASLKKNRVNLERQKAQVSARVANKESFDQELERLKKELALALEELPAKREIPSLLKSISQLGKKVGLEVRRFTPLPG